MIDLTTIAWCAVGLVVGYLHATMLRRMTRQLTPWMPVLGMLRLGVVATVLVIAALAGSILAAASGWAVGFVAVNAWLAMTRTNRIPSSPIVPPGEQRNPSHAP